jgi:hypothetical protein
MTYRTYISLWNKYRPAILKMMMTASEGTQQYKFFAHEFKGLNPKEKDYSFILQTHHGKAISNIKTSTTAQDLLEMLNSSQKGAELLNSGQYEFVMDKKFILSVKKIVPASSHDKETENLTESIEST